MSLTYETGLDKIKAYSNELVAEPEALRAVREASERHRIEHGSGCSVYPTSPIVGRLLQVLVNALGAGRVLELGCGLGYSSSWIAKALPRDGLLETVENVDEHAQLANINFRKLRVDNFIRILLGNMEKVLPRLHGPYDLIFDDCTHSMTHKHPAAFLDDYARLLRPRGLLLISNLSPVEDHIVDAQRWPAEASRATHRWIRAVFERKDLLPVFIPSMWKLLAVKT